MTSAPQPSPGPNPEPSPAPGADPTDAPATKASSVVLASLVAVVLAVVGNTIVAQIALAAGASEDFQPLAIGSYGSLTVIGVLGGLVGWLLIRRTRRPAATLRWLVPTVLIVSWVPDILLGLSDRDGVSWGAVAALMVMHLVVTLAAVITFSRLLPVRPIPE